MQGDSKQQEIIHPHNTIPVAQGIPIPDQGIPIPDQGIPFPVDQGIPIKPHSRLDRSLSHGKFKAYLGFFVLCLIGIIIATVSKSYMNEEVRNSMSSEEKSYLNSNIAHASGVFISLISILSLSITFLI